MTLQDLGNIGEFVAAIGVIVSLVYLAAQIRQNTRTTRSEMLQQHSLSLQEQLIALGSSADASRVLNSGLRDWDDLAEDDQTRFSLMMAGTFQGFESAYQQYRSGLLEEELWSSYRDRLRWYLARRGVRAWWELGAHTWTSETFASLINSLLAELAAAPPEHG